MLTQKRVTLSLVALAAVAGNVSAQGLNESSGARLFYQVFDTASNSWTTSINVAPGARVEWRAVVSYTGTNTNVSALGGIYYQPTLSNVDNDATIGTQDEFRPWRTQNPLTGEPALLTAEEGETGLPLFSYGRVRFGPWFGASNTLSLLRHTNESSNAPAGSWVRIATTQGTTWPRPQLSGSEATAVNLNAIARGVSATQSSAVSPISGAPNTSHIAGTQDLVIFRCAILLSDLQDARVLTLGTAPGSQQRVGGVGDADDRRFMLWQTSPTDNGTWRTGVTLESASIHVIPTPATSSLLAALALVATRRRRS